jgi:hypothetical protein
MSIAEFTPTRLIYTAHEDNIHEFVLLESSTKVLDEWFVYIEHLYTLPPETRIGILVDSRQVDHGLPLSYSYQKAKQLIARYPQRPKSMRYVFMQYTTQGLLTRMLQTFVQMLHTTDQTLYLYGDKRDEALAWLRQPR